MRRCGKDEVLDEVPERVRGMDREGCSQRKEVCVTRLLMCAALCLAACCGVAGAHAESAASAAPVVALHNPGRASARLSGPWKFHLGDDAAWARPEIDDSTGHDGWEQITADAPWGKQGHRSYTGYAWYRIHLSIARGPEAGPEGDADYALLAPRLESTAEFYWNGKLVALSGKMPPYPRWTYDDPEVEGDEPPQVLHLGPMSDGVLGGAGVVSAAVVV